MDDLVAVVVEQSLGRVCSPVAPGVDDERVDLPATTDGVNTFQQSSADRIQYPPDSVILWIAQRREIGQKEKTDD